MTNNFLLDWALMAVSLFNTILPLWLGLTVLLNAERRNWSIWLDLQLLIQTIPAVIKRRGAY